MQVMFADAVGEQDQPLDGLPLRSGKIGAIRQTRDHQPEFRPTAVKIDQVARSNVTALPIFRLFTISISPGCAHAARLMQAVVFGGVKKV
jgi:hypothetical protein